MALKDLFNFGKQVTPVEPLKKEQHYVGTHSTAKMTLANVLNNSTSDLSKPIITERLGQGYVPFGKDNLYPYVLLDMYNSSPFHAAICEFKANMLFKAGLTFDIKTDSSMEDLALNNLKRTLNRDFLYSMALEYILHQRIHLKVKRNGKSVSKFNDINKLTIVEAEKVRYNTEESIFSVNPDWRKGTIGTFSIKPFQKNNKKQEEGLITYTRLTKGFYVYPVPVYAKAGNWIYLDGEISFYQKQNIDNSINPSAIITLYQSFDTPEKKKKFIDDLTDSFASARNAGKALVLTANSKDDAPDIEIADANKLDKAFAGVQESIIKNIAYVHTINPVIMGVATAGKLGTTQEIKDSFNIFKDSYLIPTQEVLEDYLTDIANNVFGLQGEIKINKDVKLNLEEN